jgi:hypothetical protein
MCLEARPLRTGYVTVCDPADRGNWSGPEHAIMHSLINAGVDVKPLGPLRTRNQFAGRIKSGFYRRMLNQRYENFRERGTCSGYARQISKKNACGEYDVLVSPGSIPVSRLRCNKPVVIWADATFASYINHMAWQKSFARKHSFEVMRPSGQRLRGQVF